MDMNKTINVRVPRVLVKIAMVAMFAGSIYLGVIWAGNQVAVIPMSEFNQAIGAPSLEAQADDLHALKAQGQE